MGNFLLRIATNALGLYAAVWIVPGFAVNGGWREFLVAALVLATLNLLVKPALRIVSLPLIVLTLGLFTIVINAAILWAVASIFSFITISGFTALIFATLVISAVNILSSHAS